MSRQLTWQPLPQIQPLSQCLAEAGWFRKMQKCCSKSSWYETSCFFFFRNCTGEAHAPRERSAGWCWIWEGTVCWVNKIAVHTGGLRAWSPWWETWDALNLYKLSLLVILVRASGLQSLQCLKRPVPALVESSPTASVPGVGGSILSRRLRGCLLVQLSVLERWALSSNQSWG